MSLFYDAAAQWRALLDLSFRITFGHKREARTLNLIFECVDFDHLSGIHYADDVDFKLPRNKYRGERLLDAVLSGKIDAEAILKGENRDKIRGRLNGILRLQKILESDFALYLFSPNRLNFHSDLRAAYFLYSGEFDAGLFVFLDERATDYYCKSIFTEDAGDYRRNQTALTVLEKIRVENGRETVLYTHPSYRKTASPEPAPV